MSLCLLLITIHLLPVTDGTVGTGTAGNRRTAVGVVTSAMLAYLPTSTAHPRFRYVIDKDRSQSDNPAGLYVPYANSNPYLSV